MKSQTKLLIALLVGAFLAYGGWFVWRAHSDSVTLDVRNMEVRKVVKKIEWQTWEDIFVHKEVQGLVTLNVHKMPLEEVLRLVGDQTSSRSSLIYPVYSGGKSLTALKKSLRGEINPAENGWANLESRAGFRGGPMFGGGRGGLGGPFGGNETNQNPRVSLEILGKDLSFASLAFSRFAQAQVVPEDSIGATMVSFSVKNATVPQAVAKLAKSARRSWASYYTLRGFGFGGPGGPGGLGGRGGFAMRDGDTNGGPRGFMRQELTEAQREEMRKQREQQEEDLKQALPLAERQRLEAEQQQREQQMKELQNLTPEQRQARFAQMRGGGADMARRNIDRVKNSTPEQRAQQQRQMVEMRKRFQEQGGQPRGPGGPGGPGTGRTSARALS